VVAATSTTTCSLHFPLRFRRQMISRPPGRLHPRCDTTRANLTPGRASHSTARLSPTRRTQTQSTSPASPCNPTFQPYDPCNDMPKCKRLASGGYDTSSEGGRCSQTTMYDAVYIPCNSVKTCGAWSTIHWIESAFPAISPNSRFGSDERISVAANVSVISCGDAAATHDRRRRRDFG